MNTLYEKKLKRLDKLSELERLNLMFDLIHAFGEVRDSKEASLFLQDLLTANEIRNLSIRLRIAKLLLSGKNQREVASLLHSSLTTVNKVSFWLESGGKGFKSIISKLPLEYQLPSSLPKRPVEFNLPKLLSTATQYGLAVNQQKQVKEFVKKVESKKLWDKKLSEGEAEHFKFKK